MAQRNIGQIRFQDEEWRSRPSDYETRQRTAVLCKKALERRGHSMQMLVTSSSTYLS